MTGLRAPGTEGLSKLKVMLRNSKIVHASTLLSSKPVQFMGVLSAGRRGPISAGSSPASLRQCVNYPGSSAVTPAQLAPHNTVQWANALYRICLEVV